MIYGITGNVLRDNVWEPVCDLVAWMDVEGLDFILHPELAAGLEQRGLRSDVQSSGGADETILGRDTDIILSFGGDGTMLRTVHQFGAYGVPILGVNIGRLGFLADVDVSQLPQAVRSIETGAWTVEKRMLLEASFGDDLEPMVALNEITVEHGGSANLISVSVAVDGRFLNTYWADGLIVATATGSTAYSLSLGGPIIAPGSGVIVLTPIAPHTLTVRPIVIPESAELSIRVESQGGYIVACDGRSVEVDGSGTGVTVKRADYSVKLAKLPDKDYFETLRQKLMWGGGPVRGSQSG